MFLRRQDVIDKFDASFLEGEDGQILFQPPRAAVGLPITWEEYRLTVDAFERVHRANMLAMWTVMAAAAGFGLFKVIAEDDYLAFFLALGAAWLFSFLLHLRDGLGVLLPLALRREELEKQWLERVDL
jgi:hypothetical protein